MELPEAWKGSVHVTKAHLDGKDENKENDRVTKQLYNFAKREIRKLVVADSDSSLVFGIIQTNNHIESLNLGSFRAEMWLKHEYDKAHGEIFGTESYKSALNRLVAKAMFEDSATETIYNRVAMVDRVIWYDLAWKDWKAIRIDEDGYKLTDLDETTPTFDRKQHQSAQVMPSPCDFDALEKLCDLLRIKKSDRFIFKIHLISMFIEKYPMPIMVITGEYGSIKTTITKTIKKIIDPSNQLSLNISKSIDDLVLQLYHRYVAAYDNVSSFSQEVSDTFCRAITGDGNSKRALYKDTDEIILNYTRKIVLNGIAPTIDNTDFISRAIFYETNPINEEERLTLEEFNQEIDKLLPFLLGQICNILSYALRNYGMVKQQIKFKPRMSDFAVWGETISQGLGNKPMEFIEKYKDRLEQLSLEAINNFPLFGLVQKIMENQTPYEDTVSKFHRLLVAQAENEGIDIKSKYNKFPKAPNKIKYQVQSLRNSFKTVGIDISIYQYNGREGRFPRGNHVIKINKLGSTQEVAKVSQPPTPSQPDQIYEQKEPKLAEIKTGGRDTMSAKIDSFSGRDSGRDDSGDWLVSLPENDQIYEQNQGGVDGRDGGDKSRTPSPRQSDYWGTPRDIFDTICGLYKVRPILDVCATPENAKCMSFITEKTDGLKQTWDKESWCNPPYSQIGKWVQKCWLEHEKNNITVTALIMKDETTAYWKDYIKDKAEVYTWPHRIRFIDPMTGHKADSARFVSAIVIWRAKKNATDENQ